MAHFWQLWQAASFVMPPLGAKSQFTDLCSQRTWHNVYLCIISAVREHGIVCTFVSSLQSENMALCVPLYHLCSQRTWRCVYLCIISAVWEHGIVYTFVSFTLFHAYKMSGKQFSGQLNLLLLLLPRKERSKNDVLHVEMSGFQLTACWKAEHA